MVDHHVDRPGVEALRGVELTGTNRSIGLIASSTVPCLETKPGIMNVAPVVGVNTKSGRTREREAR